MTREEEEGEDRVRNTQLDLDTDAPDTSIPTMQPVPESKKGKNKVKNDEEEMW